MYVWDSGTGKTVVFVEAILQVHKLDESAKILVVAPTNSVCDMITERIADVLRVELRKKIEEALELETNKRGRANHPAVKKLKEKLEKDTAAKEELVRYVSDRCEIELSIQLPR